MSKKLKLPEQDFYLLTDLMKIWDVTESQINHYIYEQQSLRLAILAKNPEELQCIQLTDKQYKVISEILLDALFNCKLKNDPELVSQISLSEVCDEYEKLREEPIKLRPPKNIPNTLYFNAGQFCQALDMNDEGSVRLLNLIVFFENLGGEKHILISKHTQDDQSLFKGSVYISGLIVDQLTPVITSAEKTRFETGISKAQQIVVDENKSTEDFESDESKTNKNNSIVNESRMTTVEAAKFIGFSPNTLRNSRVSGTIANIDAPKFIKAGRKIFYEKSDLIEWNNLFKKIKSTSQNAL